MTVIDDTSIPIHNNRSSSPLEQRLDKAKEWLVDTRDAIYSKVASDRTNLVFYGGVGILCIMILCIFAVDKDEMEKEMGEKIFGGSYGSDDSTMLHGDNNGKIIMMGTTVQGKPLPETLLQPVPTNVNIVIIGDSIARYGYLSLVYFLRWGGRWFEPTLEKSNLVCERSFQSPFHNNHLAEFYFQTGRMLQPYELCDCYKYAYDTTNVKHIENRYYHDPILNNTVTFLHAYGHKIPLHGRIPPNEVYNISKWDWHKKEHKLLEHEYSEPEWEYEHYDDMVKNYLAKMVPKPEHLMINAGQWFNRFGPVGKNAEISERFVNTLQEELGDTLKTAIWRTTTHKQGGAVLANHQKETDDFMCNLMKDCLNVSWTEHVEDFLWWDEKHFYEPVYRAMNEAMLEYMGYLPKGYQKLTRDKLIKGYVVDPSQNEYAFHLDEEEQDVGGGGGDEDDDN